MKKTGQITPESVRSETWSPATILEGGGDAACSTTGCNNQPRFLLVSRMQKRSARQTRRFCKGCTDRLPASLRPAV